MHGVSLAVSTHIHGVHGRVVLLVADVQALHGVHRVVACRGEEKSLSVRP